MGKLDEKCDATARKKIIPLKDRASLLSSLTN